MHESGKIRANIAIGLIALICLPLLFFDLGIHSEDRLSGIIWNLGHILLFAAVLWLVMTTWSKLINLPIVWVLPTALTINRLPVFRNLNFSGNPFERKITTIEAPRQLRNISIKLDSRPYNPCTISIGMLIKITLMSTAGNTHTIGRFINFDHLVITSHKTAAKNKMWPKFQIIPDNRSSK